MKLGAVIQALESSADDLCVVARLPWSADADALLVQFTEDFSLPREVLDAGYKYFLGISELRNEVLGEWRHVMSDRECIEIAIHYAENDAWPEWFHDDVQQRPRGGA